MSRNLIAEDIPTRALPTSENFQFRCVGIQLFNTILHFFGFGAVSPSGREDDLGNRFRR